MIKLKFVNLHLLILLCYLIANQLTIKSLALGGDATLKIITINGNISLSVTNDLGSAIIIEKSQDLINWEIHSEHFQINGVPFTIPIEPGKVSHEFYRAKLAYNLEFEPGVVLVKFKETASIKTRENIISMATGNVIEEINTEAMNFYSSGPIICLQTKNSVFDTISMLTANPSVEFAEPNYYYNTYESPNDPFFLNGNLWGVLGDISSPMNQFGSQAIEAWEKGYIGNDQVYVGVIDTGVFTEHEDLLGNIWTNPFDPVNGIDDDGNGYIDDYQGWDFANNDNSLFHPEQNDAHGTHVAGTIGAVGNNGIGIAGVTWRVNIIPAKILKPDPNDPSKNTGDTIDAIKAVDYFVYLKVKHGINIVAINNSWGGYFNYSKLLHQSIIRAAKANILFVASSGNSGVNIDLFPQYPSGYDTSENVGSEIAASYDSVISVAAINSFGNLADFSNYGKKGVDIGAPGVDILSTIPNQSYHKFSGTSMAAPHVTGAIALYASTHSNQSANEIKAALFDSSIRTPDLVDGTVTQGRLNLSTVIFPNPVDDPIPSPTNLSIIQLNTSAIQLTWKDNSINEEFFKIQRAVGNSGFLTIGLVNSGQNSFVDLHFPKPGNLKYRVLAVNGKNESGVSNVASITIDYKVLTLYVDGDYKSDDSDGSFSKPFRKVKDAYNSRRDQSDFLKIKIYGNAYNERITFDRATRLEALAGAIGVIIGR